MTPDEERPVAERFPDRPLLLFDGDCGFCRLWVARWRATMRDQVDFAPAQQEAARFSQVTEEAWKHSVQLVTPEGVVYIAGPKLCFARWRTYRSTAGCYGSTAICRGHGQ